jgi:hypothetical protein
MATRPIRDSGVGVGGIAVDVAVGVNGVVVDTAPPSDVVAVGAPPADKPTARQACAHPAAAPAAAARRKKSRRDSGSLRPISFLPRLLCAP